MIAALVAILVLAMALFLLVRLRRKRAARAVPNPAPALVEELHRSVEALCAIGPRHAYSAGSMTAAADWIARELAAAGYAVERQPFVSSEDDLTVENVIAERRGSVRAEEIVLVGGHYDTVEGTVGADDNASGVAAVLALARRFTDVTSARTIRFVAFANEEPPHFQTHDMGSWQYAKRCHDRGEKVVAMLSLEALGYYDTTAGSQQYPVPLSTLYPDRGDFVAFVANISSRALTARCVRAFSRRTGFPVESASLPESIPGIGWSDQWAFWEFGWPAVMVTDTAPYRNPHYHGPTDRPLTLDYERFAMVVDGLVGVVEELAGRE